MQADAVNELAQKYVFRVEVANSYRGASGSADILSARPSRPHFLRILVRGQRLARRCGLDGRADRMSALPDAPLCVFIP